LDIARFDRNTPCYICGRNTGGKCGISRETNLLHCWAVGDTFTPPAEATRKKGTKTKGLNGLEYAFVGMSGAGEEWATFKVHEELEPVQREWLYRDLDGNPCVVVHRIDTGTHKKMWQAPTGRYPKVPRREGIAPYGRIGDETFVVEGEATCDALLGLGFDAITFIGGSSGNPRSLVVGAGQSFILCPDRDDKGLSWMLTVYDHITASGGSVRWLYANPTSTRWDDATDGYDAADWVADGATADDILAAVTDTPRVDGAPPPDRPGFWLSFPMQEKRVKMAPDELQNLILHHCGDYLRWNQLTNTMEIDGNEVDDVELNSAYIKFSARNLMIRKEEAVTQLITAAYCNRYHPVREYLEDCTHPLDEDTWANIAPELLGPPEDDDSNDALNSSLLRKWLVSAVARIYEPGQRADFMFVLAGAGSTHKTRFFSTLVGQDWFQEGFQDDIKARDALMKCHRFWVTEMGEVDGMTSKRAAAEVKNFITTKLDALRAPYGRAVEMHKRQFVLCATTNRTDGFLVDETGNRRFVVYNVSRRIDLKKVQRLRNRIWASALQDYRNGVDWNMSPAEMERNEMRNDVWLQDDPWLVPIHKHLYDSFSSRYVPEITTAQLMDCPLEVRKQDQHQGHLMRVGRILKSLGYEKSRRLRDGRRTTVWEWTAQEVLLPHLT